MLTDPGDLVLDIFAGSNTTGKVAETEGRRWLAFDLSVEYLAASSFRFLSAESSASEMRSVYERIRAGESVAIAQHRHQTSLAI